MLFLSFLDASRIQNSLSNGGGNANSGSSLSSFFNNPLTPNSLFPFYSMTMTPQQLMMAQMSQMLSSTTGNALNGQQTGGKVGVNPSSGASSTTETEGSPGCSVESKKDIKKMR